MGPKIFEQRAKQYKVRLSCDAWSARRTDALLTCYTLLRLQLWMWSHIKDQLIGHFKSDPDVARGLREVEEEVRSGMAATFRQSGRLLCVRMRLTFSVTSLISPSRVAQRAEHHAGARCRTAVAGILPRLGQQQVPAAHVTAGWRDRLRLCAYAFPAAAGTNLHWALHGGDRPE